MYGFVNNSPNVYTDYLGLRDEICSECKKNLAKIKEEFSEIFSYMASVKTCKTNISCKCCTGDNKYNTAYTQATRNPDKTTNVEIIFCCQNMSTDISHFKEIFVHEYTHLIDFCKRGRGYKNCEESICGEIKAHYSEAVRDKYLKSNPALLMEYVKSGAATSSKAHCNDKSDNNIKKLIDENYEKCAVSYPLENPPK